ncbi:MAG: c-type cytochrome biogenesis protein CcsB [Neisseriaceae bacterium]|nr:c-type cytochrome biogenesis protein CcsB [Neisseriaceae bacterium]
MTKQNNKPETHTLLTKKSLFHSLGWFDWVFAALIMAAAAFAQTYIAHHMDGYEVAILWGSSVGIILLGWFDKPLRVFTIVCALGAYLGIYAYGGDMANGANSFFLQYLVSSQAAIMWQSALTFLALACYTVGLFVRQPKGNEVAGGNVLLSMGTGMAWAAAAMGLIGLMVRWHESYLLRPDAGHMPVSNLYEVFVLFMVITALMYLYYEGKFQVQRLGAFVYLFLAVTVGFVLWYSFEKDAHEIQPLIPALQSWWMKIHVPANFVGYGAFCMAAMLGIAELLVLNNKGTKILPTAEVIDEVMYKAIAVGFLFFTIATVLGALWAADAWGRYWSWDPKETWAFIVWLNYAIWLHLRLVAGWRGRVLAWWAIIGLFITAFAFIGVNIFLSGLHSYGTL